MASQLLTILGGFLFILLGLLHGFWSFLDVFWPRRFAPIKATVVEEMKTTGVRISGGRTSMWDAWLGFNISHSVGVILFGAFSVAGGFSLYALSIPKAALLLPASIGLLYFLLSVRFWFYAPIVGTAMGTACFFVAWWIY
ncbi:MAG: hypothetical protein WAO55_03700 [Candidatus Manganitrophaceae bacterium]